jgi:hypothetical protein
MAMETKEPSTPVADLRGNNNNETGEPLLPEFLIIS